MVASLLRTGLPLTERWIPIPFTVVLHPRLGVVAAFLRGHTTTVAMIASLHSCKASLTPPQTHRQQSHAAPLPALRGGAGGVRGRPLPVCVPREPPRRRAPPPAPHSPGCRGRDFTLWKGNASTIRMAPAALGSPPSHLWCMILLRAGGWRRRRRAGPHRSSWQPWTSLGPPAPVWRTTSRPWPEPDQPPPPSHRPR